MTMTWSNMLNAPRDRSLRKQAKPGWHEELEPEVETISAEEQALPTHTTLSTRLNRRR